MLDTALRADGYRVRKENDDAFSEIEHMYSTRGFVSRRPVSWLSGSSLLVTLRVGLVPPFHMTERTTITSRVDSVLSWQRQNARRGSIVLHESYVLNHVFLDEDWF